MIEVVGLVVMLGLVGGLLCLVGGLVLLPLYLAFKILGFGVKLTFHLVGFALGTILLVRIALFLGVLFVLKLLLLALPLLVIGLVIWGIRDMTCPATA